MSNSGFFDLVGEAKLHTHSFTLWPDRWRSCNLQNPLSWNTYAFSQASTGSIPDQPGVYAFLVQPNIANNLNASYLMYIGKTERPLRARFQEYLREVKNPSGRPKICFMLGLYDGYLSFSCAVFDQSNIDVLENELLQAFIPPANDRIPAEVGRAVRAFQH